MNTKNDSTFSWRETGSGQPVVFLHAMAGSATAWEPQLDELSSDYNCLAWDMPGYGDSVAVTSVAPMGDTVAALAEFIAGPVGGAPVHAVGLSVGGMILQHAAASHPDLFRSITIMDTSPKFGHGGSMAPEEFSEPFLARMAGGATVSELSTEMVTGVVGPKCPVDVIADGITSMSRATPAGLELAVNLIAQHDALDKLSEITAPTLVMVGEDDSETPVPYAEFLVANIDGAQLKVVPAAGHLSNLENPAVVNETLAAFFAQA